LNFTIKTAIKALEEYDFYTYTTACYDFWLKELCSVYLELIKPVMFSDQSVKENVEKRKAAQLVLYTCVEQCLRLLHPAMPFITEDLWQRLPGHNKKPKELESIMINPFPKPVSFFLKMCC
jgi:valyl-tRNA synthetase